MALCLAQHVASGLRLLLDNVLVFLGFFLYIKGIETLLVQIDLFLALNKGHLVLEILLHLLVLAEFDHVVSLGLDLVLSRLVINHLTPKAILLFLKTNKV